MTDGILTATIIKADEWLLIEAPDHAYLDELQGIVEMFPPELRSRVVVVRAIKVLRRD